MTPFLGNDSAGGATPARRFKQWSNRGGLIRQTAAMISEPRRQQARRSLARWRLAISELGVTSAQLALAWLLHQGP
jgi:aryl-alcohol dehydrogenase-like predicted oxidoreductase